MLCPHCGAASDWPTRAMTSEAALVFFKRHALEGDLTFYLQLPYLPLHVRTQLSDLLRAYRSGQLVTRAQVREVIVAWRAGQSPRELFGDQMEHFKDGPVCPVIWQTAYMSDAPASVREAAEAYAVQKAARS